MTGKVLDSAPGEMLRSCRLQSHHIEIVPLFLDKCLNSGPGPPVLHRTAADAADKDSCVQKLADPDHQPLIIARATTRCCTMKDASFLIWPGLFHALKRQFLQSVMNC
jgi:hypothetical protein